jgi:type II secretory pathway component PulJ
VKGLKNNNGFTLIETLVSINLSFVAISLIFSFYLFAQKFSESISRNYTDKYIQMSFFYNLERTLSKSDEYFIKFIGNKIIINTSNGDSIYISNDSISLNGIFEISKLEKIDISISADTEQDVLSWSDGVLEDPNALLNENNILESNSIHSILFKIERNKKILSYQILSSNASITHLKNILTD